MDLQELLKYIAFNANKQGIGFGITKLIKLAYLSEVLYYRKHSERLTDVKWHYYKYGPYPKDNIDDLKSLPFEEEEIDSGKPFQKIDVSNLGKLAEIPFQERSVINSVISQYGKIDLNDLLDYVYYETEPMMFTEQRGEILDFSHIRSESNYTIKDIGLSKREKSKLQKKAMERFKNARSL